MAEELTEIVKAESFPTEHARYRKSGEVGQPKIIHSSAWVEAKKNKDFSYPRWFDVCEEMYRDSTVYTPVDFTNKLVVLSLYKGEYRAKKGRVSKDAADLLNYSIRNLSYGTFFEALNNICSDMVYGFSIVNPVLEKKGYGPYGNKWTLRKISPRPQKSITGFLWNDNLSEVLGALQTPLQQQSTSGFYNTFHPKLTFDLVPPTYHNISSVPTILPADQILHAKFDCRDENPLGNSPLKSIYQDYEELLLAKKYELIGLSKSLGGSFIVRVPDEAMKAAEENPEGRDAEAIAELEKDAADWHAGEISHLLMSSAKDEKGNPMYDVDFKGFTAASSHDTTAIIEQRKKSIYNAFGAGFLLLGQESVGSYNLASSHMSVHAHYVEYVLAQKREILDRLGRMILLQNGLYLTHDEFPEFAPADNVEFDWDVWSKVIQRVSSTQRDTPKFLEAMYDIQNLPKEGIKQIDFSSKGQSRAGESLGTSGIGLTQAGGLGTALNSENAVSKSADISNFVVYKQDAQYIYLIDRETDKVTMISKL